MKCLKGEINFGGNFIFFELKIYLAPIELFVMFYKVLEARIVLIGYFICVDQNSSVQMLEHNKELKTWLKKEKKKYAVDCLFPI